LAYRPDQAPGSASDDDRNGTGRAVPNAKLSNGEGSNPAVRAGSPATARDRAPRIERIDGADQIVVEKDQILPGIPTARWRRVEM
jgi:hypothetical protein